MADPPNALGARALIVGSGFGGLAAAIRLQAAGYRCALFEARDKPGGRAYVYERDGFRPTRSLTEPSTPTVITAPQCLEDLFAAAGRRLQDDVELLPVTPFYRLLWEDGDRFDYSGDGSQLEAQIAARNPGDVAGYRRFLDYSRRVFHKGYEELAAQQIPGAKLTLVEGGHMLPFTQPIETARWVRSVATAA